MAASPNREPAAKTALKAKIDELGVWAKIAAKNRGPTKLAPIDDALRENPWDFRTAPARLRPPQS
jgi:hypothetical protein